MTSMTFAGPAGRLGVGNEVAVVVERGVDTPSPLVAVETLAGVGTRLGRQTLAQPPIPHHLFHHQVDEAVVGEPSHVTRQLGVLSRVVTLTVEHRPHRRGVEMQRHGHGVFAERAVLGGGTRTRPHRIPTVDPQRHRIRHRPTHRRLGPLLADVAQLHPPVVVIRRAPQKRTRFGQAHEPAPEHAPHRFIHAIHHRHRSTRSGREG